MARNVFRKYKALYPEELVKPHIRNFNAIEAIYNLLHQKTKTADVTQIIKELQSLINESIYVKDEAQEKEQVYIDLSKLDFEKLQAAFSKIKRKNTVVFNLQQAIENKLEQMLKENPLRLKFYERYREIIEEYNKGKSLEDTVKTFNDLNKFFKDLSLEERRNIRENLEDQETLAIFDLLNEGKELSGKERKEVKKIAKKILDILKAEKLKIERWRESRQITAQVKGIIYDNLLWLPESAYSDEEVGLKTTSVYQHVFTNYYGGGVSAYQRAG